MKTLEELLIGLKPILKEHSIEVQDVYELIYFLEPEIQDYTTLVLKKHDFIFQKEDEFNQLFARLKSGEPVQYIVGSAAFLNYRFMVDQNVLIPRMETEELVLRIEKEIRQKFLQYQRPIKVLDLCSGSGVIGLTLALRLKAEIELDLTFADIEENALFVNKNNAKLHQINAKFIKSDLFKEIPTTERYDVIVANPPYIENIKDIDKKVFDYEPRVALLAYPGTKFLFVIIEEAKTFLNDNFVIGFEINYDQREAVEKAALKAFPFAQVKGEKDISNHDRNIIIVGDYRMERASSNLINDHVVALPSETVYGLASIANYQGFMNLCFLKKRDPNRPYSVLFKDLAMAKTCCEMNQKQENFLAKILPGPITVILEAKDSAPSFLKNTDGTIGVRISSYPLIQEIFSKINEPLLFTSVNQEGQPPLNHYDLIKQEFGQFIYVYETYQSETKSKPSTIIKLFDKIELVREGETSLDALNKLWEEE